VCHIDDVRVSFVGQKCITTYVSVCRVGCDVMRHESVCVYIY